MIPVKEMIALCKARADDATALFEAKRYDGAVYTCGYVVEIALKIRICKTLKWQNFPPSKSQDFKAFKVHNLDFLLTCSGKEVEIKKNYFNLWSFFTSNWNSEMRYENRKIDEHGAAEMLKASQTLQINICKL